MTDVAPWDAPDDHPHAQAEEAPWGAEPEKGAESADIAGGVASGITEPAMAMATSLVAKPISDVAGLAATVYDMATGNKDSKAAEFQKYVQESLSYTPKTNAGQQVSSVIALPGKAIGWVADQSANAYMEALKSVGASPAVYEAVGNGIRESVVQAANIGGMLKGGKGAAPRAPMDVETALNHAQVLEAQEMGINVPPSLVNNASSSAMAMEGIAGRPRVVEKAKFDKQPIINKVIADDVGIEGAITPDAVREKMSQVYEQGYGPLKNVGDVPLDQQFHAEIRDITKTGKVDRTIPAAPTTRVAGGEGYDIPGAPGKSVPASGGEMDPLTMMPKEASPGYEIPGSSGTSVPGEPGYTIPGRGAIKASEGGLLSKTGQYAMDELAGSMSPKLQMNPTTLKMEPVMDASTMVDKIQMLRNRADSLFKDEPQVARAYKKAAGSLESQLDRHLEAQSNPAELTKQGDLFAKPQPVQGQMALDLQQKAAQNAQLVDQFRSARVQLAKLSTLKKPGFVNPVTGDVNAIAFGKLMGKKPFLLTGGFAKTARFANAFKPIAGVPMYAPAVTTATNSGVAMMAGMASGHGIPAVLASEVAIPFGRKAAGNYSLKPWAQRPLSDVLHQKYNESPMTRKAIFSSPLAFDAMVADEEDDDKK